MADAAVSENPGRDRAQIPVAVTARPVRAGTTTLSGKTLNNAAPPAPFRETRTPGTNCGIVAW